MGKKIYIITPVFNEEKVIRDVLLKLSKTKYPLMVVDDGSTDGSKEKIESLKLKNLTLLSHKVNLGKGAAMKTGAEAAFAMGADAIVFMDSDGQHEVKDLPKFIEALEKGYDIVFGSRNLSYGVPFVRYMGNKFGSLLVNILFGIYISDLLCGYRAMTKKAYKKIKWESTGYGVETEMVVRLSQTNLKYCEVPIKTVYLDKVKGVTLLDAVGILFNVIYWRLVI